MEKSESIKAIASALLLFHVKVDKVKKDSKNPFFKSSYASLSTILDSIDAPLNEAGLSFCQFPYGENGLTTILMHAESGEFLMGTYEMKPVKDDPQGRGSAITYQRRYALASILGLNIEDDDDANVASNKNFTAEPHTFDNSIPDNRPWMSEAQFKAVSQRIVAGEKDALEKADKAFKMKKDYRQTLKELYAKS
jgi:hypothetical protein